MLSGRLQMMMMMLPLLMNGLQMAICMINQSAGIVLAAIRGASTTTTTAAATASSTHAHGCKGDALGSRIRTCWDVIHMGSCMDPRNNSTSRGHWLIH